MVWKNNWQRDSKKTLSHPTTDSVVFEVYFSEDSVVTEFYMYARWLKLKKNYPNSEQQTKRKQKLAEVGNNSTHFPI